MSRPYHVHTPEAVDLDYDLAGIGARGLALMLDTLFTVVIAIVMVIGLFALALLGLDDTIAAVLGLVLFFLLIWGYFILFETIWSGTTPGKRKLRIRVITTDGRPIGFPQAAIRNLVRIVDMLPSAYAFGIVTMFISPDARRLGDYAAGTIVVKERKIERLERLDVPARDEPERGAVDPDEHEWDLRALTSADLTLAREFVARAPGLPGDARARIGGEVATRIARRIQARAPLDATQFVQRVLALHDSELESER